MTQIIQKEDPILRKKSSDVPLSDIQKPRIVKIIQTMKEALDSQQDGVAIAAPQIGENLRIFVVSEKVFELSEDVRERKEQQKRDTTSYGHLVFINPKITKLSREKDWMEEGCLSVRWLYGKVNRSLKATITAYDEKGKKIQRGASGLLAQVFQHEIDHLEGILFSDKAKDTFILDPEKITP